MAHPRLVPYCELPAGPILTPVGHGAQVVQLTKLAQMFRASYLDPFGKERALPPHYWELQKVGDPATFIRGTRSDKHGFSGIIDGKKLRAAPVGDRWYLVLRPDLKVEELETYRATGDMWIDLDKDAWVVHSSFPQKDSRKLLRLPIWTSRWKAQCGGFVDGPPGTKFLTEGTLTSAEVRKPYGTPQKAWRILLDHEWFRTYMVFGYYDCAAKYTRMLPPGIVLKALGDKLNIDTLTRAPGVVGAGTAFDELGMFYVLHERTEEQSADVELSFENTSGYVWYVDLKESASSKKLKSGATNEFPAKPTERYRLPDIWYSRGWWAKLGSNPRAEWVNLKPTGPGASPARTLDTDASAPLKFNLDDTILADAQTGPATIPADARITLFDHRLAFRGPSFDPVVPHWWSEKISSPYLLGEKAIATDGNAYEETTFVINHEGDFYVLRDERIDVTGSGTLATSSFVGARKAVARGLGDPIAKSPFDTDPSILLLLPDAYPGPYTEATEGPFLAANPDAKLCHLLVYVSCSLQADPGDSTATPAVPAATTADLNTVRTWLIEASKRWDQLHPAHAPFTRARKDYVVTPKSGVKKDTRVIKLRHFFGERPDGKQAIIIDVTNKGDRSFVSGSPKKLTVVLKNPNNFGPGLADHEDKGDGVSEQFFTLAHELGHVMWLPDEYMEPIKVDKVVLPVTNGGPAVPCFEQRDQAYPFWPDHTAMMRWPALPRLRYYAHRLPFIEKYSSILREGPYVLRHPKFRGGLTYVHPPDEHAWVVHKSAKLPGNRAKLVIFRVGDDEATTEALFPRPLTSSTDPGTFIDAIVVIRTDIWFRYRVSNQGDFLGDDERWMVLWNFYQQYVWNPNYEPPRRFVLQGPKSAPVRNIGVIFEPRFEFGPFPMGASSESNADFVVEIVYRYPGKPPATPQGIGSLASSKLVVQLRDEGPDILRYALGHTINTASPDKNILGANDMDPVARTIETMLGQAAGSFSARVVV